MRTILGTLCTGLALLIVAIPTGCGSGGGSPAAPPAPSDGLVSLSLTSDAEGRVEIDVGGAIYTTRLVDAETGASIAGADVYVVTDGTQALVFDPHPAYEPQFAWIPSLAVLDPVISVLPKIVDGDHPWVQFLRDLPPKFTAAMIKLGAAG